MFLKSKNKLNFDNALNLAYPVYLKYNFDVWSNNNCKCDILFSLFILHIQNPVYILCLEHISIWTTLMTAVPTVLDSAGLNKR